MTLDALSAPVRVLRQLALDFGHLPVPAVDLCGIYPGRLSLSLHDSALTDVQAFAAFELWREALEIPPAAVSFGAQSGDTVRVLRAAADFAGAEIVLKAFTDAPGSAGAFGSTGGAR
ncbi:hypothetical protein AB0D49_34190 [Streptomyces sp. NPDC048290]|uniref:hypothetical protein n=1 Tax=Streptomyces sp. NPDC048290 TaxID=3155811 RepID=UPI0034391E80